MRQLSKRACVEGRSWRSDDDGIWVDEGCRAEFAIGAGSQRGPGSGYGDRVVRCDSKQNRWNHCAADTGHGIELVRQLSERACIRDRSWGVDERGVWVSGGCRAEFRMKSGRQDDDRDDRRAQIVRCESRDGRPTHCPVDTDGGVRLVRQLSKAACTEDRSWSVDRTGIWVERGCRADFEIGFREDKARDWRWWRR